MSRWVFSCAVLGLAAALPSRADATPAAADTPHYSKPPPGYHDITVGGSVIRVADQAKPRAQEQNSSGPYDPESMNFGRSSSMADKTFNSSEAALSKSDSARESQGGHSFFTHPFSGAGAYNQSASKFQTVAFTDTSRHGDNFAKSFTLPGADAAGGKSFAASSSAMANKTAAESGKADKTDPFATPSSLNEKTFFDPELKHVRRDPYAPNDLDVSRLVKLPDRPLTIDEVRNLINHEQTPDLSSKPDAPSKALNEPGWEPPASVPPASDQRSSWSLRASPMDATPIAPPAPGEMAQPPPENSQPPPTK